MRRTMFGRVRVLLHPQRDFFFEAQSVRVIEPLSDILGQFSFPDEQKYYFVLMVL